MGRLNPPSCDREVYENEQPLYWYIIQLWQDRKGVVEKYKHGRENTLGTNSFNPNLAEKTMYALLVSQDDAPEPFALNENDPGNSSARSTMFVGSSLVAGLWIALMMM